MSTTELQIGRMADVAFGPSIRTRVLIVEDHELVRAGLTALLDDEEDIRVVGALSSGEEALRSIESLRPDVVLLNHRLPGMNGAALCTELGRRWPQVFVIILTFSLDEDALHSCLVAGARGFLLNDTSKGDLARTVRTVARGEAVLAPQVADKVLEWARRSGAIADRADALTQSESRVLSLVAEGLSNPSIAQRLHLSTQSVKLALRSVMRKLGVASRSEAVAVAIRRGLV